MRIQQSQRRAQQAAAEAQQAAAKAQQQAEMEALRQAAAAAAAAEAQQQASAEQAGIEAGIEWPVDGLAQVAVVVVLGCAGIIRIQAAQSALVLIGLLVAMLTLMQLQMTFAPTPIPEVVNNARLMH